MRGQYNSPKWEFSEGQLPGGRGGNCPRRELHGGVWLEATILDDNYPR